MTTVHEAIQAQEEEKLLVAEAMVKHGGGFVMALGNALYKADLTNADKIRTAFPEYWGIYLNRAMVEIDIAKECD